MNKIKTIYQKTYKSNKNHGAKQEGFICKANPKWENTCRFHSSDDEIEATPITIWASNLCILGTILGLQCVQHYPWSSLYGRKGKNLWQFSFFYVPNVYWCDSMESSTIAFFLLFKVNSNLIMKLLYTNHKETSLVWTNILDICGFCIDCNVLVSCL